MDLQNIQVKICGLTKPDESRECANLGADAIGLVFYPKSPRCVDKETAKKICKSIPDNVSTVGVFVDEDISSILEISSYCGLKAVQLHGNETNETIERLKSEGLIVIKGLFVKKPPFLKDAHQYNASSFLIELGTGNLPGGNAIAWDFELVKNFDKPFIIAGGLSLENVSDAVLKSMPDAVDVSSGVEIKHGIKNIQKVASFIQKVKNIKINRKLRRIF
ncbi:MAG: phosphoribosylanthranilate isomerase [Desulfobacterales bacterium]|nr:phosphoribosylanthranilate isomerase [Desulfobacterales bacterium]